MAVSAELQNIQAGLYRLRRGYFYNQGLLGAGIFLGWMWISFIVYLTLAYSSWRLILPGLVIFAVYAAYVYIRRPSLDEMVTLIDRRCKFEQRLVTVWQYRNSQEPVLPLLSKEVVDRLAKISVKAAFPLKINPKIWLIPLCLLIINGYFWRYPLLKSPPSGPNPRLQQPLTSPQDSSPLIQIADQIEQFSEQLAHSAGSDPVRQSREAERLKEISRDIQNLNNSDPAKQPQELEAIKQKLSSNITPADAYASTPIPSVPPPLMEQIRAAEPEKRPRLEFEVKSRHLLALLKQMDKLGLTSEQIKNQLLRDLLGSLDSIVQIKMPGEKQQLVQTQVIYGTGDGIAGTETSLPDNAMVNYPQPNPGQGWQEKPTYAIPTLGNLSPAYRDQVQAILKNRDIPKAYHQQVTAYFDAANDRF